MAILTNEQLREHLQTLRRDPVALAELKAATPSRPALFAALQACENWFTTAKALEVKTAMEAASGLTLTNALAKKLFKVWMMTKWRNE